jgi:hypothetical protein
MTKNTKRICVFIFFIIFISKIDYNMKRNKKTIRLTESDLHDIIKESVIRILNEGAAWDVLKDKFHTIKNASPEEVEDWGIGSEDYKEDKRRFIQGSPDKDNYQAYEFRRKNPDVKAGAPYDPERHLDSQPGLSGKLKRGAVAHSMDAMARIRSGYDKLTGKR